MRTLAATLVAIVGITASACGAITQTVTPTPTVRVRPGVPTLTSALVTFLTRDEEKEPASAVTVELLKDNTELAAEAETVGARYGSYTTSAPLALAIAAPYLPDDTGGSHLRLRMAPEFRDEWYFDVELQLGFSDGSVQSFFWSDIELSNTIPERHLGLMAGRVLSFERVP